MKDSKRPAGRRPEVCVVCGKPRAEVAQLLVGPDLFLCDRCLDEASGVLLEGTGGSPETGGRCSFCEQVVSVPVWVRPPVRLCAPCLDLLNAVILDALGPEALRPAALRRTERVSRKAEREERRLEMALMARRSTSLKQEIVGVNLSLIVQNVKDLLELMEGSEGHRLSKAVSLPRRREAAVVFDRLLAALGVERKGARTVRLKK